MKATSMDGTPMDSIFMSTYQIDQFIPQKENTDNDNEKPIAKLECTLDSVEKGTQRGSNFDPDAGANARSRAEIIFGSNNSLSELVWSPRNGLRLKCADHSLNERKCSLFWSSESGNMIISSPGNVKAWESNNNANVALGDSRSTQPVRNPEIESSNQQTLLRSHSSSKDMIPPSQAKSHELDMRLHGGMDPLTAINVSAADVNHDDGDQSPEKEMDLSSPIASQINVDLCKERMVTAAALPRKTSFPEPHCEDSAKGAGSGSILRSGEIGSGNTQRACMEDTLVSEASTRKQYYLTSSPMPISQSLDGKNCEPDLIFEENNRNKMEKDPNSMINPCTHKLESTAENDLEALEMGGMFCSQDSPSKSQAVGRSAHPEMGMIVAHHEESEGENGPAENTGVGPMENKAPVIEGSPDNSSRKGKEKSLLDTEVDRIISKGKDDSHDSVQSGNSRKLFSEEKRAWSFEQLVVIGSKRIKKQHHKIPHSASFLGQDSSFLNWISNMEKSSPKFYVDGEPSLAVNARPHQSDRSNDSPSASLNNRKEDPHFSSAGFQNVHALYCQRLQQEDKKNGGSSGQKITQGSKELEVANKIPFDVKAHRDHEKEIVNFSNFFPTSSRKPQVGECSSIRPIISSFSSSMLLEKPDSNFGENHNSCRIACGLEKGGVRSSEPSFNDDSGPLPEGKGINQVFSVDPDKPSNLVTNKSKPLGSLWITRFSPKVSGPLSNSVQFNQDTGAAIEWFTDLNSLFHQSQNVIFSIEDRNNLKVSHDCSTEDHLNAPSRKELKNSISASISCGSKRMNAHTNQKFKSKQSPVPHFQEFKNSDAVASSFAKRLDALGHIKPFKDSEGAAHTYTFCYFCGIHGHALRDCSWINDTEIKDLMKNIVLYHGAEEISCYCIKCSELSHWAITCPHVSPRKQINTQSNTSLAGNKNCDRIPHRPQNQSPLADQDKRNMLQSESAVGKHRLGAHTISHGENSRAKTKLTVQTNVGTKLRVPMLMNGWTSDLKPMRKDIASDDCHNEGPEKGTSKEFLVMGKSTASSSENELKENQIIPFHDHVNRQIPDIPEGTFETLRKLRLSRKDILKWSKSPISNFSLEGYFVRLRMGKWKERLGGTGYDVACISGASGGRPCGTCNFSIPVDIGAIRCLVGCRYVSNHDFTEEELIAWWRATLRGNGRLPSEEDLNLKLLERRRT